MSARTPPYTQSRAKRSRGQAMTETVIVSAFFLVPFFLLMPMLAKLVDVRHSAVQAARYEAWEYTVYYAASSDKPDGLSEAVPIKTAGQVRNEAKRRFFSRTDVPIAASDGSTGWRRADARPLWTTFDGEMMYDGAADQVPHSVQTQLDTPPQDSIVLEVIDFVWDTFDLVFSALGDVMDFLGADASFDVIDTEGYIETEVTLPVETTEIPFGFVGHEDFDEQALGFQASASVLSNGWSSGSTEYTRRQVRGLVPTSLLDGLLNPEIGGVEFPLQDIFATVFLSPEIASESLRFGYVADDVVHPDRLSDSPWQGHNCTGGINACDFNPK